MTLVLRAWARNSIVERYARALPSDCATLATLRHPDLVEDWPQSGERIRGHANYQAIHENYPGGPPDLKPRRIIGTEDRWVVTPSFTPLRIIGTASALGGTHLARMRAV